MNDQGLGGNLMEIPTETYGTGESFIIALILFIPPNLLYLYSPFRQGILFLLMLFINFMIVFALVSVIINKRYMKLP